MTTELLNRTPAAVVPAPAETPGYDLDLWLAPEPRPRRLSAWLAAVVDAARKPVHFVMRR